MKKINIKFIVMLATVLILSGCSVPKSSFVITVPQNTKIEYPQQERTNNGIKVTASANEYVGLLVATDPVNGLKVPFGIDYKYKMYHGDGVMAGLGIPMAGFGGLLSIMGAAFCKEDEMLGVSLMLPGMAAVGAGLPLAISGFERLNLLSHEYKFAYVPVQRISFNGISSTLAHIDPPKNTPKYSTTSSTPKPSMSSYSTTAPNKSTNTKKSQSKDIVDNVIGIYSGSLKILEGQETVESYSKATVELSKLDKSKVRVTVKVRGENFYNDEGGEMIASVIQEKNGSFRLKMENNPDAIIKVDKSKVLRITQDIYGPNGEQAVLSFMGNK